MIRYKLFTGNFFWQRRIYILKLSIIVEKLSNCYQFFRVVLHQGHFGSGAARIRHYFFRIRILLFSGFQNSIWILCQIQHKFTLKIQLLLLASRISRWHCDPGSQTARRCWYRWACPWREVCWWSCPAGEANSLILCCCSTWRCWAWRRMHATKIKYAIILNSF